jgi:lipopolysaccharide biosynthesis protein
MLRVFSSRLGRALRFILPDPLALYATWKIRRSGLFDRTFYRACHPTLNRLFTRFPERHYVLFGEAAGFRPNPVFSPDAYRRLNPDLAQLRAPFLHYVRYGRAENRATRQDPATGALRGPLLPPVLRRAAEAPPSADLAIVVHVYYPDLWDELVQTISEAALPHDLFVTYTDQGDLTEDLTAQVHAAFPQARVIAMPNHGRDIFPFVHLINSGLLSPYRAACKIHTKKSPHRQDGDDWRRHLIAGLLPGAETQALLRRFLDDPQAALWVADGQHYTDIRWWGSNQQATADLLARVEVRMDEEHLSFPAGSMYWLKPLLISMIRGMQLDQDDFELEIGQVDGTTAHAFERAIGYIIAAGGQKIRQSAELREQLAQMRGAAPDLAREVENAPHTAEPPDTESDKNDTDPDKGLSEAPPGITPPSYVSAFYLPQFHRTPENDAWWGQGYTEWQAAAAARPQFPGHAQPVLPGALGFYDLMRPQAMREQAALARQAGIDAFCCYYYWFDGKTLLDGPLQQLLKRPKIDFPFYLCWANESWRRNWDGMSGEVLIEQTYAEGFEEALAQATLPYMRDPRYQRPDGSRPRFVIYRPEDLPDPEASVAALRLEWQALGVGPVELGAVRFHVAGDNPVPEGLFDFQIEMPPHGLVTSRDYLVGGPPREGDTRAPLTAAPGFSGLIYDYDAVIANSLGLGAAPPRDLIAGVMPSWDNTARRGRRAHIAHGANPASFTRWLRGLSQHRIASSYRQELFINAWNEWAEKAMLEPSRQYDKAWLEVLGAWRRDSTLREGRQWHD